MSLIFVAIMFIHWVADFVFQSHWMASNKSKSSNALVAHIVAYTTTIAVGGIVLVILLGTPHISNVLIWALINGLIHMGVDFFTSRITSTLYKKGDIHSFFVVIGFDQFLHLSTLVLTWKMVG